MTFDTTFLNAGVRLSTMARDQLILSGQLYCTRKVYIQPKTGNVVDLGKLTKIANETIPLTMPYRDAEGRFMQLWKTQQYGLIGAVYDLQGRLKIIQGHKIQNSLIPNQSPYELMLCLENSINKYWDIAYDVVKSTMVVWPHLEAAGKDGVPIRINGSPLRFTTEADLINKLQGKGYQRVDATNFTHTQRGMTAQLHGNHAEFTSPHQNHTQARNVNYQGIHADKQNKHVPGAHNYQPGKGSITISPAELANLTAAHAGKGRKVAGEPGAPGYKERVDFGKVIGTYARRGENGEPTKHYPTTKGIVTYDGDGKAHVIPSDPNAYSNKWRFAYGEEPPKNPPGGKPQNPSGDKTPAGKDFQQRLQQTRLTDSYNGTHRQNPVPAKGATGGDIGGVACSTDYIEGLFDSPESMFEREHLFCFATPDGQLPFSDMELRQIMRELAIGIYTHSTVPFFSLHFNQNGDLFPVIHPVYENTLVGRVISMLDYIMKGYLNGGVYTEQFIDEWQKKADWNANKDSALQHLIDFSKYCQKHFQGSDRNYLSVRAMLMEITNNSRNVLQEAAQKIGVAVGAVDAESEVLKNFTGFSNSFRIIAKQNSIKKEGNLFLVDGDFDVLYTINPSPAYIAATEEYFRKYGSMPPSYVALEQSYRQVCVQIKTHMSRFPMCRSYFAMLNVINFFSGYFSTLKKHRKVPVLPVMQPLAVKGSPSLFPHLPVSTYVQETLQLNLHAVLNSLKTKENVKLINFCKAVQKQFLGDDTVPVAAMETELIALFHNEIQRNVISLSSSKMRRLVEEEIKNSSEFHKMFNELATDFVKRVKDEINNTLNNQNDLFSTMFSQGSSVAIGSAFTDMMKNDRQTFKNYLRDLHLELMGYQKQHYSDLTNAFSTALRRHASYNVDISGTANRVIQGITEVFNKVIEGLNNAFTEGFKIPDEKKKVAETKFAAVCLKSEMPSDHLEKGNKIVGGCGMELKRLVVRTSNQAAAIFRTQAFKLSRSNPETWTKITIDQNTMGMGFRLLHEDVPPDIQDDYAWMESLLLVPAGLDAALIEERHAIQSAMRAGEKSTFQKLVDASKKLSALVDAQKRSLMHIAAGLRDPFYVQYLLSKNLPYDSMDIHGYQPGHYAAMAGSTETMQVLLKAGANVNAVARNGANPLIVAVQHRQLPMVSFLLKSKATHGTLTGGYNSLHCVMHEGDLKIIYEVLGNQPIVTACLNQLSEEGGTPLMLACELDSPDLVQKLIDLKADTKVARKDGVTAIEVSISRDCIPVTQVLLRHAPLTPHALETAAKKGSVAMLTLLESQPAFYQHRNYYNDTLLHTLLRFGNLAGALFVIKNCKDVNYLRAENHGKETAFALTAGFGAWDLIEELSKKNAIGQDAIIANMPNLLRADYHPALNTLFNSMNLSAQQLKDFALLACNVGNYQALSFIFVPRGIDLSTLKGPRGWRAVHYLAKADGLHLFRSLVVKDRNLLQPLQEESGKTTSYIAGLHRSFRVFRFVLEQMKKDQIPLQKQFKDRHLLYSVIEAASLRCTRLVFEIFAKDQKEQKELANVELDSSGIRPVHLAARMHALKVLKLFISFGADPKAVDKTGKNALGHSLKVGAKEIAEYLIKMYGRDLINSQVMYEAAKTDEEIFNRLLKINAVQNDLDQALILATQNHDLATFKRLQKAGASINATNAEGLTPLIIASRTGQSPLLTHILKEQNLKRTVVNGNTPLHEAALNGHTHCVAILLNAGFKNEANAKGKKALELSKNSRGVQWLVGPDKDNYLKNIASKAQSLIKARKDDFPKLIAEINDLPINEPIQIEWDDEVIWGTPFQLFLRIHQSQIKLEDVQLILNRRDLDPNVPDSDGNTIAHLLLQADIFPKTHIPINWKATNHNNELPVHMASKCAGVKILHAVLQVLNQLQLNSLLEAVDDDGDTCLHYAVLGNRTANVELLTKAEVDLSIRNHQLMTPLIIACMHPVPLLPIVKALLGAGANPNQLGTPGRCPALVVSIVKGHDEITRTLLFNGASCRASFAQNSTYMHLTAQKGKIALLRLFAARGLSFETRDALGKLPIHEAGAAGKTNTVKSILALHPEMLDATIAAPKQHDEDQNKEEAQKEEFFKGLTTLDLTASQGHTETVEYLLARGASTETGNKKMGVLSLAASFGTKSLLETLSPYKMSQDPNEIGKAVIHGIQRDNLDTVMALYQKGLSVHADLGQNCTGVQIASRSGSLLSTQWLLQQGADPLEVSPFGQDSLQLSAENDSWQQFELILDFVDPDLDELRNHRETLLHTAAKAGKLNNVVALLTRQASINVDDSRGFRPVHLAVQNGRAEVTGLLLACGADTTAANKKALNELVPENDQATKKIIAEFNALIEANSKKKDSPLQTAVRLGNALAVLVWINQDIDLDYKNAEGETALHIAVGSGLDSISHYLIRAGTDLKATNRLGKTAMGLAKDKNNGLVAMLESATAK
jgi:ankyrin repeat protein